MKKILLSMIAAVACLAMNAETTVTFTSSEDYQSDHTGQTEGTLSKDGVTIVSSNCALSYTAGFRFYSGSTLTISTDDNYAITQIVLTSYSKNTSSSYSIPNVTAPEDGEWTYEDSSSSYDGTWTGSSTEVVFTMSAQVRITTIEVTYDDGTVSTAKPTFSPEGGTYFEAQTVEISCETDGATIYYSTDGETYSTYTEALTISETTTLYAYATSDDAEDSSVASATYTIKTVNEVANIAAALEYASSDGLVKFTNSVTAVYQYGSYLYVTDDTGWMLIYGSSLPSYSNGDVIPAGFYGKMTIYNNLYELSTTVATSTYSTDSFEEATETVDAISPTESSIADITADSQNIYVKFSEVWLDSSALTITDTDGNSVAIYKRFITTPETGAYSVEGFVSVYGSTVQILLTSYEALTYDSEYWISGTGNNWSTDTSSDTYAFTNLGFGNHTLSLDEWYGEFKIIDSGASSWYGYGAIELDTEYTISTSGSNISLPSSDTYTGVTITLTESDDAITLVFSATGLETTDATYYAVGYFNSWVQADSDYQMELNENGDYYVLIESSLFTTNGTEFKIVSDKNYWYGTDEDVEFDTAVTISTSGGNCDLVSSITASYIAISLIIGTDDDGNSTYTMVVTQTDDSSYTGISALAADGRTVVSESYYNLAGQQVVEPADDSKALYIVVRGYDDGTTEAVKEVR